MYKKIRKSDVMSSESTRRIAKNTGFLYVRMLLTMGVAFYTSRVVLNALGVEDYGIYNVVGGVVAMFSFLTGMFTSATQRFLNYEMGLGNRKRLNEILSMSITLNTMIAVLIVLVSEIVGLWFINHKLVIPVDRLMAAHWVFQFSLLTMAVTIISTPYNAVIIANERMDVFAYISIIEVILKLGVAVIIASCGGDKLIVYGALLLFVALIIRGIYSVYCKRKFQECRYRFYWDKTLFREMGAFAGWNMYGNFAFVMITQGVNMLLNMFFGPVVNASRAIAVQVQTAIQGFSANFMMAVNPRITQDYAQGEKESMFRLVCVSAKLSFYLLLILIIPVLIETETLLKLWLKQVPEYSVVFVRLTLIQTLIGILTNPLQTAIQATGRMKKYQLLTGTLTLMNIPISYFLLCYGSDAPVVLVVYNVITCIMVFVLLYLLNDIIDFPISLFVKKVLMPALGVLFVVSFASVPLLYVTNSLAVYMQLIIRVLWVVCISFFAIWKFGLAIGEKMFLKQYLSIIKSRFHIN